MCQILTRISPFGMAALYEHVRLFRSPCSGGITIKRGLRIFLPVIQNLVKIRPALFHGIRTGKQGGVARQAVFQQANVSITRLLCIPVITVIHLHCPHIKPRTRRFHGDTLQDTLIGLDTENQFFTPIDPSFILNICMGAGLKWTTISVTLVGICLPVRI